MATLDKPSFIHAGGLQTQSQSNGKSQAVKDEQLSYVDDAIQRTSNTMKSVKNESRAVKDENLSYVDDAMQRTSNTMQSFKNGKGQTVKDEQLSYVDDALQRTSNTVNWAASRAKNTLDRFVPPEQSSALKERVQDFASENPKLAAFLLVNLVFSGVPVLFFTVFSASVFVFSILTGLIMGLMGALVFTSSVVGVALLFFVPTVLLTTIAATTLFFWTIVGLYVYAQINNRRNPRQLQD